MENYVVSARKYRPSGFDEVVGQAHITTTLANAIKQNQLAQAYLFCGPRGVGKTTCARIVARLINEFEDSNELIPGGSPTQLNIYELDAASNNSVDDIRNLVEQVRYPPQYGKYKVYIIDEVHMLSNAAFNAFLKTLEEPPPYAIFILATTEKHKVIPTILSRCQIFDFKRIQISDITNQLAKIAEKEGIRFDIEALNLIAQKSEGAMRDALSLFDLIVTFSTDRSVSFANTIETLHILDYDYYFKVTDLLKDQKANDCLLVFDEILGNGFDGHQFVMGLGEHFRHLMVCKDPKTVKLLPVSEAVQQKYIQQSAALSMSFIVSALSILNNCDIHYKSSKNQRMHVELALIKLGYLNSVLSFEAKEQVPEKTEVKAESAKVAFRILDENEKAKPVTKSVPPKPTLNIELSPTPKLNMTDLRNQVVMEAQAKLESSDMTDRPLQLTEARTLLQQVADSRKADESKFGEYRLLNNCEIDLIDENCLMLRLDNILEVTQFNEMREELQGIFRKRLQNQSVLIQAELKPRKEEDKKLIYSNKEKLDHLIERFPVVGELKARLGLDYD